MPSASNSDRPADEATILDEQKVAHPLEELQEVLGVAELRELQTAVRLARNPVSPLIDLGNLLLGAGRTTDALEQFRSAARAAPNSAEAHIGLGTALFRAGRLNEAAAEHTLAVRLAPALADAHYNLAATLAAQDRLREAAAEYERTLQLEGDSASGRWGRMSHALRMCVSARGSWREG